MTIIDELNQLIDRDELGLHKTQFESIKEILQTAITELETNLGEIKVEQLDLEDVYDSCRDFDEATIWLQRLWSYLSEKFGQRNGTGDTSRLLKAADEVVWSCFHGVLLEAVPQHGPAPLTYIEPEYSPATIQTDMPMPASLRLEADLEFLDQCLETIPLPVLRLPPTCVSSPWWLILIGHEVGHHVQYALDLVAHFRTGLAAAAESLGFSKDEAASTWGRWGEEIFSDVFSILIMGESALRAIVELETGPPDKMTRRKPTYPSPVIRLALMKELSDRLELNSEAALLGLDLKAIAHTDLDSKKDYTVVPAAIDFVLKPLPNGKLLTELCRFSKNTFSEGDRVNGWSILLKSENTPPVYANDMLHIYSARDVICGSLKAWAEHGKGTEATNSNEAASTRNKIRNQIKKNTVDILLLSGPRDTRASGQKPANEGKGKALADLLRNRSKRKVGEQGAV